jgi:prolyl-tRNA synthetase
MRFSTMFGGTLRETPSDAELVSHKLSIRAGLIRQLATGIYSYLPLGLRVLRKIEKIVREEMEAIDGQELLMPIVQPASLWKATGRYDAPAPGPALLRFRDRTGHDMVLAMTHEEAVTDLARQVIHSYRQLPLMVYQFQTKFRDEARSRGGLVRVREFLMKDAYSFHPDQDSLDEYYPHVYQAYARILERCGVQAVPVAAASGMMAGSTSHEFMVLNQGGEDSLILCPDCKYAANAESASFAKGEGVRGQELPVERVPTPGATTIEKVAQLLGVETRQTLKVVFYTTSEGEVIFSIIRGDLEVNESKLSGLLGGVGLQHATAKELETAGLVAGYASPIGISGIRVIADDSVRSGNNFVAGANEEGYHLKNVNYPRDFEVDVIADIALVREGDACPNCGTPLTSARGIEVGHIFKLGIEYAETLEANYLDRDGTTKPLWMGCYGIGLGRLLACILEQHHDEHGIIWPASVAPFQVHIVALGGRDAAVEETAETLYARLRDQGFQVLYDDRRESPGVKFNDADLIGIPVRLTISRRSLKRGGVEIKARWEDARRVVPDSDLERAIQDILQTPR